MFSQSGTDVLLRRDEGSGKPCAMIEPNKIMVPTRTDGLEPGQCVLGRKYNNTKNDALHDSPLLAYR